MQTELRKILEYDGKTLTECDQFIAMVEVPKPEWQCTCCAHLESPKERITK